MASLQGTSGGCNILGPDTLSQGGQRQNLELNDGTACPAFPEPSSGHTFQGASGSGKCQEEHQYNVDKDEKQQNDKDNHTLGLGIHVASEDSMKRAQFLLGSIRSLSHVLA
ncbi:Hypothetical predicted protein [Pelobates cultripes]|uniref:Uncharacterized protein n=1 Tax=Pelobates cultripes TaxID=61616 RepID=A0AAD1VTF7_PELCU|nr:Hypothetical predicted protein [Pelobates cultripes]